MLKYDLTMLKNALLLFTQRAFRPSCVIVGRRYKVRGKERGGGGGGPVTQAHKLIQEDRTMAYLLLAKVTPTRTWRWGCRLGGSHFIRPIMCFSGQATKLDNCVYWSDVILQWCFMRAGKRWSRLLLTRAHAMIHHHPLETETVVLTAHHAPLKAILKATLLKTTMIQEIGMSPGIATPAHQESAATAHQG